MLFFRKTTQIQGPESLMIPDLSTDPRPSSSHGGSFRTRRQQTSNRKDQWNNTKNTMETKKKAKSKQIFSFGRAIPIPDHKKPSFSFWGQKSGILEEDTSETDRSSVGSPSSVSDSSFRSPISSSLKIKTEEESLRCCYGHPNSPKAPPSRTSVQFSDVKIHYHDLDLGDHPDVSSGPPLALGELNRTVEQSLSDYERSISTQKHQESRPWVERARIDAKERVRMLMDAGVTMQRIQSRIHYQKLQKKAHMRSGLLATRRVYRTCAVNR